MSRTPGDDAAELEEIARGVRALAEWLEACGAAGVAGGAAASHREPTEQGQVAAGAPPQALRRASAIAQRPRPAPDAVESSARPGPSARRAESRVAAPEPVRRAAAPVAPRLSAAERELERQEALARLAVLEQEVKACTRCPLAQSRTRTVFARGSAQARLVFVGEGPGAEEDAQGLPFVGAAGQLLDRMIGAMGYRPEEVYICNVVKCRPPDNRKPEAAEMQACAPYLHEQLSLVAPEVIVALGATAVQGLLEWHDAGPYGPGITRLRGNWKLYRGRTPFMPTFHPAYLLRTPSKKRDVWSDLQAVMARLEKPPAGAGPQDGGT